MSKPFFEIDVDDQAVLDALDALGDQAQVLVMTASRESAERIAREARARVARRTGETASHIVAEESYDGKAWVVWVEPDVRISMHENPSGRKHTQRVTYNAIGSWLEFGTVHMTKRPFLFVSAQLEETSHRDRVREALQDAIDESGLGE